MREKENINEKMFELIKTYYEAKQDHPKNMLSIFDNAMMKKIEDFFIEYKNELTFHKSICNK